MIRVMILILKLLIFNIMAHIILGCIITLKCQYDAINTAERAKCSRASRLRKIGAQ